MTRISYSEDEDYPGQFDLFQANCSRALQGKHGQRVLRELEESLLALPNKRLVREELVQPDGEVCAFGAFMLRRAILRGQTHEAAIEFLSKFDPYGTDEMATEYFGVPRLVAWKIVEMNDIMLDEAITPEERYERMLKWVRQELSA